MSAKSHYELYRGVIAKVLNNQEDLPSLPAITLKIRQAINNPDTSAVGWIHGDGLLGMEDRLAQVDEFIAGLGDESINLYVGPLNWQDGSSFLAAGEAATDQQIWYAEQLLEGVVGASSAE